MIEGRVTISANCKREGCDEMFILGTISDPEIWMAHFVPKQMKCRICTSTFVYGLDHFRVTYLEA